MAFNHSRKLTMKTLLMSTIELVNLRSAWNLLVDNSSAISFYRAQQELRDCYEHFIAYAKNPKSAIDNFDVALFSTSTTRLCHTSLMAFTTWKKSDAENLMVSGTKVLLLPIKVPSSSAAQQIAAQENHGAHPGKRNKFASLRHLPARPIHIKGDNIAEKIHDRKLPFSQSFCSISAPLPGKQQLSDDNLAAFQCFKSTSEKLSEVTDTIITDGLPVPEFVVSPPPSRCSLSRRSNLGAPRTMRRQRAGSVSPLEQRSNREEILLSDFRKVIEAQSWKPLAWNNVRT